MALSITATPDPGAMVVRLYVAGGVPPYTVAAQPSGGQPAYVVRSPQTPVTGDATARNMLDGQAPLGQAVSYAVTDSAGSAAVTAAAVTLVSTLPVLSDALDPTRYITCTVVSQKPNHWAPRSVFYDVLGRRDPTVAIGPLRLRDGELVLATADNTARRALLNLLASGNPLLLRTPSPTTVDDVTLLVTDLNETLLIDGDHAGWSLWGLTYQGVTADLGPFAGDPSRTYATVVAGWPTYGDLPPAYADYAALLTGNAYSNLGSQLVTAGWDTPANVALWSLTLSTRVTLASVGGVGVVTAAGGVGLLACTLPGAIQNVTTVPGKRYRVTFKARVSAGALGAIARVHVLSNTQPAVAGYFQPGLVTAASPVVTLSAAWQTISYDGTLPAGDDIVSMVFRVESIPDGGKCEIQTPSVREILP